MRRKIHRLPRERYVGKIAVSYTACERRRQPGFCCAEILAAFQSAFERAALAFDCKVPFYCVMPDHLHAIVMGHADGSDTFAAMEKFKHLSGKWLVGHRPHLEWQDGFYDHIIREGEGWRAHGKYLACNPIRAGFVEEPNAWPFFGCVGYELNKVMEDIWL